MSGADRARPKGPPQTGGLPRWPPALQQLTETPGLLLTRGRVRPFMILPFEAASGAVEQTDPPSSRLGAVPVPGGPHPPLTLKVASFVTALSPHRYQREDAPGTETLPTRLCGRFSFKRKERVERVFLVGSKPPCEVAEALCSLRTFKICARFPSGRVCPEVRNPP